MRKLIVIGLMLIMTSCTENPDFIGNVKFEFPNSKIYVKLTDPTEVVVVDSTGLKIVYMNPSGKILSVEALVER